MLFFLFFPMNTPDMGVVGEFCIDFWKFFIYRGIGRRRSPGLRLVGHKALRGKRGIVRASREAF